MSSTKTETLAHFLLFIVTKLIELSKLNDVSLKINDQHFLCKYMFLKFRFLFKQKKKKWGDALTAVTQSKYLCNPLLGCN